MKILHRRLEKDSSGVVKLLCEEGEDMWHVYNLIREGDIVQCSTFRKVINETSTGSKSSNRMQLTLTIRVETIDFEPTDCALHLKGRTTTEHQHVKLGSYHTIDLDLNRPFYLTKQCWDHIDLHRLQLSTDIAHTADVAAITMHEGYAEVSLISSSMTVVKAKIDTQIPHKRKGFGQQHEKSMQGFFKQITASFLRHVNMDRIKCVLVASPGFFREQFLDYLMQHAEKEGLKNVKDRSKFLLVKSSSGFKHALKEVLSDPAVANRLSDTKAQAEVKALNQFQELMAINPDKAVYGLSHVQMAIDEMAIETLMVSDSLFRSNDITERKTYVDLVETVKYQGATILIFSSMHVTGEQLSQLTGVAAILRFPIPGLSDFDDDDDDDNNDGKEAQTQTTATATETQGSNKRQDSTSASTRDPGSGGGGTPSSKGKGQGKAKAMNGVNANTAALKRIALQ